MSKNKEILLHQLMMLMATLFHTMYATTYYVIPNDEDDNRPSTILNSHTLSHYLNNTEEYFKSNTQLFFQPGHYHLASDLTVQDVTNFTITGKNSNIICGNSSAAIAFINVEGLVLKNVTFLRCGGNYSMHFNFSSKNFDDPPLHWSSALYLNHCISVEMNNILVIAKPGMNGIVVINATLVTQVESVSVVTTCKDLSNNLNGIVFYNYDALNFNTGSKIRISQYNYTCSGLCLESFALKFVLVQETYSVDLKVENSDFVNLSNSGVLYYHGESCGIDVNNTVTFENCKVRGNSGNFKMALFHILIHSNGNTFSSVNPSYCIQQVNIINFTNCHFINNSNMNSIIYNVLKQSLSLNAFIYITDSKVCDNNNVRFIYSNSQVRILWQLSHYIIVRRTNISSNTHMRSDDASLINLSNGLMRFSRCIIFNNRNFYSIIRLHYSVVKFINYNEFSGNLARHILQGKEGSYFFLKEHSVLNISNNFVYTAYQISSVYNNHYQQICYFQFTSDQGCLDAVLNSNKTLKFKILMSNNVYTAPQYDLINIQSKNCMWIPDTAFRISNSTEVFAEIFSTTDRIQANKSTISNIASSVCLCSNSHREVDCTEHKLGSIYPGQTLRVQLKLKLRAVTKDTTEMIVETNKEYLPPDACSVTNVDEIKQYHTGQGCSNYSYTIWSTLSECKLYLAGRESVSEIFYVKLMACPVGFSMQESKKCCHCDTILNLFISILSCNLDEGTIQRPADSWISGETVNGSHVYSVSKRCPFDYCLRYSSHLNPSNPDSQCQFRRSGILCGHCQQSLSTVFGTHHCQQCSNLYLLIIVPIMIVGVILVICLFKFNLTITHGTLNSFILYVNIININSSTFFPYCHGSFICILASLLNLDLGIKTCFYNGMDDYGKMWLKLLFPLYLVIIAFTLIIGSRYSTRIQRLTAQRALPVLATLFLLSYTKILQAVSTVLFRYSSIIHLPSKHVTLVWSIDANVPIFGVKFTGLFIICLILFLILLVFNFLLLFTRMLSHVKFINTFKPLFDAYFGPYQDKLYFWTGLQLLMRAVIFALSGFDRDINLTGGIFVIGIALCTQGILHPFKSKSKNAQELLILLNLLMVYVIALQSENNNKNKLLLLEMLILIALMYFIIYIAYHCVMVSCSKSIKQKMDYLSKQFTKINNKPTELMQSISNNEEDRSCSYDEFQESLVAFD